MDALEAIKRIQILQAIIVSKNKEDREYVCALQMGIDALKEKTKDGDGE